MASSNRVCLLGEIGSDVLPTTRRGGTGTWSGEGRRARVTRDPGGRIPCALPAARHWECGGTPPGLGAAGAGLKGETVQAACGAGRVCRASDPRCVSWPVSSASRHKGRQGWGCVEATGLRSVERVPPAGVQKTADGSPVTGGGRGPGKPELGPERAREPGQEGQRELGQRPGLGDPGRGAEVTGDGADPETVLGGTQGPRAAGPWGVPVLDELRPTAIGPGGDAGGTEQEHRGAAPEEPVAADGRRAGHLQGTPCDSRWPAARNGVRRGVRRGAGRGQGGRAATPEPGSSGTDAPGRLVSGSGPSRMQPADPAPLRG